MILWHILDGLETAVLFLGNCLLLVILSWLAKDIADGVKEFFRRDEEWI